MSNRDSSFDERFNSFEEKLNDLISKVSQLSEMLERYLPFFSPRDSETSGPIPFDGLDFARLPNHLRKTLQCLQSKGEATAIQVAEMTRKERAVESDYLNQLYVMGLVGKKRKKRSMVFYVSESNGRDNNK